MLLAHDTRELALATAGALQLMSEVCVWVCCLSQVGEEVEALHLEVTQKLQEQLADARKEGDTEELEAVYEAVQVVGQYGQYGQAVHEGGDHCSNFESLVSHILSQTSHMRTCPSVLLPAPLSAIPRRPCLHSTACSARPTCHPGHGSTF